jgi:hypothetical protein
MRAAESSVARTFETMRRHASHYSVPSSEKGRDHG